jgi:hypothetical protein
MLTARLLGHVIWQCYSGGLTGWAAVEFSRNSFDGALIVTGICLAMQYTAHVELAFSSLF